MLFNFTDSNQLILIINFIMMLINVNIIIVSHMVHFKERKKSYFFFIFNILSYTFIVVDKNGNQRKVLQ